jgi:hypothetical protein
MICSRRTRSIALCGAGGRPQQFNSQWKKINLCYIGKPICVFRTSSVFDADDDGLLLILEVPVDSSRSDDVLTEDDRRCRRNCFWHWITHLLRQGISDKKMPGIPPLF